MTKIPTGEAFPFYEGIFEKLDFTYHFAAEIIAFFSFLCCFELTENDIL